MTRHRLSGWGRTSPSVAEIVQPDSVDACATALASAGGRGAIARGLGRSYGDLAQNGGGLVLDMTALAAIRSFDRERGTIVVDGGCSLAAILPAITPAGWSLPVVPGTRFVTVGGAIACDVHGKNHHRDGSFGQHVSHMTLLGGDGRLHRLEPRDPAFAATVGGLGLTGVVVEATLTLVAIETAWLRVDSERTQDLDGTLQRLSESDSRYRYSVAWLDCTAGGGRRGRGILIQGDHAARDEAPGSARPLRGRPTVTAPPGLSFGRALRSPAMTALNDLHYRRARVGSGDIQGFAPFFFPLDAVGGWNAVYGRSGFLQYQFVVPSERADVVHGTLQALAAAGIRPTLAVLKRLGEASPAPLSFPSPGWTLALDIALPAPGAAAVLAELDRLVAGAGGRVYLAKDSRLAHGMLREMYPRLGEWRRIRDELDPGGRMQHDLGRRLRLLEDAA